MTGFHLRASELPPPPFSSEHSMEDVFAVPYARVAEAAAEYRRRYDVPPSAHDKTRICLLLVDEQLTFCHPGYELFVAGANGRAALDDAGRLCAFLYANAASLTSIAATLDTHTQYQLFHPCFFVGPDGRHPQPFTTISAADIQSGRWRPAPGAAAAAPAHLRFSEELLRQYLLSYAQQLEARGRYSLTIWPYHAMLGSTGHALLPSIEAAMFFHSQLRYSPAFLENKGRNPLTESYSALRPEVTAGPLGIPIARPRQRLLRFLRTFDAVIIAGQAKSHCVLWTIEDLVTLSLRHDKSFLERIYVLEDCTSPIVVPGAADYTAASTAAFAEFQSLGVRLVQSTRPIETWP